MIPISNELNDSLSDDTQIVRPKVLAWMSDLRSLDNLKAHSSSHTYSKQVLDRNPQMYLKLDSTEYAAAKKVSNCLTIRTSYGGAMSIQSPAHGLVAGDEIVFTTDSSVGLPYEYVPAVPYLGGLKSGEIHFTNRFYVQNPSANYFNINTIRANAISNSSTGRVVRYGVDATVGLSGITVTVGLKATFTYTNHGYSDGDAIVLSSSGTIPGGITAKTDTNLPIYYIQNATANTFNLNTSYANVVNGVSEDMVETTSAGTGTLSSFTIHKVTNNVLGGHRVKDHGEQAFDVAIGTSDASTPIYDANLTTSYHETFINHIEILEPNRLIDTFNKDSSVSFFGIVSPGTPGVFYSNNIVANGSPVKFYDVGTLTGINTSTIYYVQNSSGITYNLNTSYYNALNNISTGRVNTGGVSGYVGIYIFNKPTPGFFTKFGSTDATNSIMDYYSWTSNDVKWTHFDNQLKYLAGVPDNNKRYVYTYVNSLDHSIDFKVDSGRGRDIYARFIDEDNCVVLSYGSPSYTNPIQINAYIDGNVINLALIDPAVLSAFNPNNYYRFQSKYNVYSLYQMGATDSAFTVTIASPGVFTLNNHGFLTNDIVKLTTTGSLPTGLSAGISYYVIRLTANTFNLSLTTGGAAINTSGSQSGTHKVLFEPTNATVGTLIGSGYFDHPKLRTEDAKKCGVGFSNQITLNPTLNANTLECSFDYFAVYGYNSLSNFFYFNYDNADVTKKKYLYSSTALSSAKSSQFQSLNNASNFTYSFYIRKTNEANRKSTIFWLGNQARETAVRISYVEAANDYINVTLNTATTTYTLDSTALVNDTIYHVTIVKNGTKLSIYINGVEVSYRNDLPANFVLKDVVTGSTPYIMFGADYAGTTLGDAAGYHLLATTYISEFAMFDYSLTQADINAMYYSIYNGGTLYSETSDKYFNSECIIDGQLEETFTFAFTNMLNYNGSEIKANNSTYCPSPVSNVTNTSNIEENYGWMSRVQSGSLGSFTNNDFVELTFDVAPCNKIFVSTGFFNGRIGSFNYLITKSDLSTLSGSKSFSNSSYALISSADLGLQDSEYLNIVSVKITPTSTVNPYDYARLFSINPIWEVDLSDYVISFSLDKIRDNYDASLPIGATAANNGSLVLDNTDKVFNMFGNTLYGKYTTPDVPIFISFDHQLPKYGTSEEILLASEMYADTWNFSSSSMTVEVSFRDYSKYVQEKTVLGYIGQGISAGRAIMDLMLESGFPRRKISFIDKYDDTIFTDNPKMYVAFNDTVEELQATANYSAFGSLIDQCDYKLFTGDLNGITLGKSLLYSDTISVQDESQRKSLSNIESTFEPYYRQGSISGKFTAFGDIFGNSQNSWTTELYHYIDIDNFTAFGVDNDLVVNMPVSGTRFSYKLTYNVTGENVVYSWSFKDTSDVIRTITSASLDANVPHQIVVRKTGGASNIFDLIIDTNIEATLTTNAAIALGYSLTVSSSDDSPLIKTFISNFSFYDYALDIQSIANHYISASVSLVPTYRYLYAADQTYWEAMLSIATADLGMFYIDEYGYFKYEYRNFIHEELFERYQNSQYTFADDVNIIQGNYVNEIQTNKISVAIKKVSVESSLTSQLWSASNGESLITAVTTSEVTPQSTSISLNTTTDPYWMPIGYIKLDNEIIKYNNINGNVLTSLERGYFNTSIAWHPVGSTAREAKYYTVSYSSKPAAAVKYPLLTNTFVEIDSFSASAGEAEIVISVKNDAPKNSTFVLSGTNVLTGLDYGFVISGAAVGITSSEEVLTDMVAEINSNIRRYGVKELKIDNPFIQNKNYAQIIANYVLGYYKEPIRTLSMDVLAVPHLQLGDLVTISKFEDLGIVNKKYWIISNSISYDGGINQSLSLLAYSDTIESPEFTFGSTPIPYIPPSGGGEIFYPQA